MIRIGATKGGKPLTDPVSMAMLNADKLGDAFKKMTQTLIVGTDCVDPNVSAYTKQQIELLTKAVFLELERGGYEATYKYDRFDRRWVFIVNGTCVEVTISEMSRGLRVAVGARRFFNPDPLELADIIVIEAREQERRFAQSNPTFKAIRATGRHDLCLIFSNPRNTDELPDDYTPQRCSACGAAYVAVTALIVEPERWSQFTHHIPHRFPVKGCILLCSADHQVMDLPGRRIGDWVRDEEGFGSP